MLNYYKYLQFDIHRAEYFENELIRFTQPDDLNDPFECSPQKPTIEEFNKLVETLISKFPKNIEVEKKIRAEFNEDFLEKLWKETYVNINKDIAIFSLSKNWNNILMWSHYADCHKGFCIGFNSEHDFFKNIINERNNTSKTIYEVKYSSKRYKIPMIIEERKVSIDPFITKSKDWKYEQEIRMIISISLADNVLKKEPYDICLFKVPHSSINEIVLGANMNKESEKIITEFCITKNIKLYKSIRSESEFNMERK